MSFMQYFEIFVIKTWRKSDFLYYPYLTYRVKT